MKNNREIDSRLQRIANLLLLNASFINNIGLLNGKMGISILFYHYARYTGENIYEKYAGELIDEIYAEITQDISIDFEQGLTGIGWGIEYLVENRFLEVDTDEVLEDVDETIYQRILLQPAYNEFKGILLYLTARLKSESKRSNQKVFLKKHNLISLLGQCEKLLVQGSFKNDTSFPDVDTPKAMRVFLIEIMNVGLFPEKTKTLVEILTSFFEAEKLKKNETDGKDVVDMATGVVWNQLVYSPETNLETDHTMLFQEVFEFIDKEENWDRYVNNIGNKLGNNLGISNGLTGIAMALLNIEKNQNPLRGLKSVVNYSSEKQPVEELSVFIFKSAVRGMKYGMGTYVQELSRSLLDYTNVNVFTITFHSYKCKEFTIEPLSARNYKIDIPCPSLYAPNDINDKKYASRVSDLLSAIISRCYKVIFQINFIDGLSILKKLKENYKYPVITAVHSAAWQEYLVGNKKKLNQLKNMANLTDIDMRFTIEKELYQLSDSIISVTHYMKDFLMQSYGINPDTIAVIPNGIDYGRFQNVSQEGKIKIKHQLGFGADEQIILFVGRVDTSKGIYFLTEAFAEACKHNDNLRLVIVGEGRIEENMRRTSSHFGKITYTGFISQDVMMQFYQVADVGIVPSIYDHCPYTVLEMMASKIPLIVSDIDGLNEMLGKGQAMIIKPIVGPKGDISIDIYELADVILFLLKNETIRNDISNAAYAILISKNSAKLMGLSTLKVYETSHKEPGERIKKAITLIT